METSLTQTHGIKNMCQGTITITTTPTVYRCRDWQKKKKKKKRGVWKGGRGLQKLTWGVLYEIGHGAS